MTITHITSRDNPLVKDLRRLTQENAAYRKIGSLWLEGDHLCRAALARGWVPQSVVFAESLWNESQEQNGTDASKRALTEQLVASVDRVIILSDALFADISNLESPARVGYVVDLPEPVGIATHTPSVILDRVQDAGNVGSILRSAGAFGFKQIIALKGTAALWSNKVLRAGMGAHFGLRLIEGATLADLDELQIPLIVTSSHLGEAVHAAQLPMPCAWAMGHEGQGASEALVARAQLSVRIQQPGGEESLNVAAAAAICLYASSVQMTSTSIAKL